VGAPPSSGKSKKPVWAIVLAVVAALVVLLVILGLVFGNDDAAANFEPGECTNDSLRGEVTEIETVDCDEEHEVEAFGSFDLEGDELPDDDEIAEEANDECLDQFEEYVGIEYAESIYIADYLPPTEDAFDDGLRTVVCIINGSTEGDDLEGSAEGTEE
jgi:hypothetical protein